MELLNELVALYESLPGVLIEKITSPHVLSRHDITVILNVIRKNFGLSYDTNQDIGLCLLSQCIFSIAASVDMSEDNLAKYVASISHHSDSKTFNNLGKLIEWFNSQPMKIGHQWIQFKLNAHPIHNARDVKDELRSGQPVICAAPATGRLQDIIDDMENVKDSYVPDWLDEHKEELTDLKNGFISKKLWDLASKEFNRQYSSAYHVALCFGYEAGDRAFLFREPRPKYARHGYYKISEDVFTRENIGPGKWLFHGMFYVEVLEAKPVTKPENPPAQRKVEPPDNNDHRW